MVGFERAMQNDVLAGKELDVGTVTTVLAFGFKLFPANMNPTE